jgi:hypothetical protein
MGWTREARAHTSPVFGEMEDNIPSIRKGVMLASTNNISIATAIKKALLNNRYTSATAYLHAAKESYVHKLPAITQTSPLRDENHFINLAFPEGVPTITNTEYKIPSAMDLLDSLQTLYSDYDTSVHSSTYTEYGATFIKAYTDAVIVDNVTFSYVETITDSNSSVISSTTKVGARPVGYNTKVLIYTFLWLGLPKIKLYHPAVKDASLIHSIFSAKENVDDFVAYPIYPLLLDSVYIDSVSREEEYTDAKRLFKSLNFPIETVFDAIKAGVPVPTDSSDKVNEITDVFILNAININSTTQAGKAYLFEFFNSIYLNHVDPGTGSVNWSDTNYSVIISESDYNFGLNYNQITNTVVSGVNATYGSIIAAGGTIALPAPGTITLTAPNLPGETTHRRLVISGVWANTLIDYPSGATTFVPIAVSTDSSSLDYANFCIPLIHGVLSEITSLDLKEAVFLESFVIVSHSLTEYYLKWYESLWREIKQVVIIAVTILAYLYIQDGGITAKAFFTAMATAVATNIVLEIVLPFIDDPYLKAAVAIVVSYAIGNFAAGNDALAGFNLLNPATLISMVDAVGNIYIENQIKDLQERLNDFVTDSDKLWEELKEKQDMLEESEYSDMLAANLIANIKTYEDPTSFYARTTITNPGVLVYEQLTSFFDNKLKLPELSPTGLN